MIPAFWAIGDYRSEVGGQADYRLSIHLGGERTQEQMGDSKYLSAADTAKLIRKTLRREFPAIKFGVTTDTYAGGATVNVQWVDGPTTKQVDGKIGVYGGAGFDGMVDLKFHYDAWLMPDGTATIAKCHGSGCTFESYENPSPHPDAKRVSFGADFISTRRHHSPAFVRRIASEVEERLGWEAPPIVEQDSYWSRSRDVPTAYFEDRRCGHDESAWREFTNALYNTPADKPAVTSWDLLSVGDEEPELEPQAALTPEQNKVIHDATVKEIEENRERNDRAAKIAALPEAPEPTPAPAPDPEPPAQADDTESVKALLLQELRELATEIIHASGSKFVHRCVTRKIKAIGAHTDLATLIQVGDDLTLIAETA